MDAKRTKRRIKQSIRRLMYPLFRLRHGGDSRWCPICENSSSAFLDHQVVLPREDAKCPFCKSLERHRLIWIVLQRKTNFFTSPPRKVLDIAPDQMIRRRFRKLLGDRYITADLLEPDVDVKMDITDVQYPDKSVDFIFCSHVFEHVPDDRKGMKELHRILTGEGVAIIAVPITAEKTVEDPSVQNPQERLRLFGQEDHVRRYGPDFKSRLSEAGFTVTVYSREDLLSPREIERMGIIPEAGEVFLCRK